MGETFCNDLRGFIEASKKISDWKEIKGADWDLEIGALIETAAELIPQPPMLLFDEIKGYPPGFRVAALLFASYKRAARDHTNSRAIFYAVRPFEWRDQFPKVSRVSRELREKVMRDFQNILPFPKA